MFCPKCGAQSAQGKFCRSCGTNLAVVSEVLAEDAEISEPGDPASDQLSTATPASGVTLGLFGSAVISNEERDLAGHKAAAIFGNLTVDLTATPLPEGETHISTYTIFGSIDILVPDNVGIRLTGITALSGVSLRGDQVGNGFFHTDEYVSPNYQQSTRRLHIEIACLFSGLKIRR